jgi:hypothetical protein
MENISMIELENGKYLHDVAGKYLSMIELNNFSLVLKQ